MTHGILAYFFPWFRITFSKLESSSYKLVVTSVSVTCELLILFIILLSSQVPITGETGMYFENCQVYNPDPEYDHISSLKRNSPNLQGKLLPVPLKSGEVLYHKHWLDRNSLVLPRDAIAV